LSSPVHFLAFLAQKCKLTRTTIVKL
jgi:hypothetical protein